MPLVRRQIDTGADLMKEEDLMTARDHFALAAMVELIRDPDRAGYREPDIAEAAYTQAYFMMKVRKAETNESN